MFLPKVLVHKSLQNYRQSLPSKRDTAAQTCPCTCCAAGCRTALFLRSRHTHLASPVACHEQPSPKRLFGHLVLAGKKIVDARGPAGQTHDLHVSQLYHSGVQPSTQSVPAACAWATFVLYRPSTGTCSAPRECAGAFVCV